MLTTEEIDFWDGLIGKSGDLKLARKFYPKVGRPERVKEVFISAIIHLASYPTLLQQRFDKGAYTPELTDDEVRQIAAKTVEQDVAEGYLETVFKKLNYPVYAQASATLSDEQIGNLVNKVLREGIEKYHSGEHPKEFAELLIEFPEGHECSEELSLAYAIFDDSRYQKFAQPELANNIVTLKVFHYLLLGKFEEAIVIKNKYTQYYDAVLAQQLVEDFIDNPAFNEQNYPLEYLVMAQKGSFRDLFPQNINVKIEEIAKEFDEYIEQHRAEIRDGVDVSQARKDCLSQYKRLALAKDITDYLDERREVSPTKEMDDAVLAFRNEDIKQVYAQKRDLSYKKTTGIDKLNRALDKIYSGSRLTGLSFAKALREILENQEYVDGVGKEKISEVLTERTAMAMQDGKANLVYELAFGINLGEGDNILVVPHFGEYVNINKSSLLESMISQIHWFPEHFLSGQDDCCDIWSLSGIRDVDNAYELYKAISQEEGRLPSVEQLTRLMFIKMAKHTLDCCFRGAKGMKIVASVFEDPANSDYINEEQVKGLLTKVFSDDPDDWTKISDFTSPEMVPFFYALSSSKLGALVKDDQRLAPYFKLHSFLEAC